MTEATTTNPLDAWLARVAAELGLDPGAVQRDLLLDVTKDVAHNVARPAAPLTAFLIGLAAGRAGGTAQAVQDAAATVTRLASDAASP